MAVQIEASAVFEKLRTRIGELEQEKAILQLTVESLSAANAELEAKLHSTQPVPEQPTEAPRLAKVPSNSKG
jgi:hypothetical protein